MRHAELVTFGGGGLDRAAHLRSAPATSDARVLLLWRGKILVEGERLAWLPGSERLLAGRELLFLGQASGQTFHAADLAEWEPDEMPPTLGAFHDPSEQIHPELPGRAFAELRHRMTRLSPDEAELAATARALLSWHATHGFCARCGAPSEMEEGGWQRRCDACGARHFPRTDPVVIMLVTRGNSVLVGRSPAWPDGFYSLLAGFVEPGETVEAAVRRETLEEAGVRVGPVSYLASQPWPFPSSLMLGCRGEALSEEIRCDPAELADARWVTREEMVEVVTKRHPEMSPARRGAIARFLIDAWLADRLD